MWLEDILSLAPSKIQHYVMHNSGTWKFERHENLVSSLFHIRLVVVAVVVVVGVLVLEEGCLCAHTRDLGPTDSQNTAE